MCEKVPEMPGEDRADEEHIAEIIADLPDNLTKQQKILVKYFIQRYASLFSKSKFDLGRTDLMSYTIDKAIIRRSSSNCTDSHLLMNLRMIACWMNCYNRM